MVGQVSQHHEICVTRRRRRATQEIRMLHQHRRCSLFLFNPEERRTTDEEEEEHRRRRDDITQGRKLPREGDLMVGWDPGYKLVVGGVSMAYTGNADPKFPQTERQRVLHKFKAASFRHMVGDNWRKKIRQKLTGQV